MRFKIQRFIIMAILIVFTAPVVWAAPFLVCTVDPVVTNYLIKINGANAIEVPAPLHCDLEPLLDGTYNLEVAARNEWGQSIYVPFDFIKKLPDGPLGLGLSAD